MSGWGRRGGAHLLLGEASVPLATCGQGGAQGPFLQRPEPETGRWPGHLELAGEAGDTGSLELGKVRPSSKEKRFVYGVPTGRVGLPTGGHREFPYPPVPHHPWPWLEPCVVLLDLRTCSVTP